MAAARAMTNGDWNAAIDFVQSIKVWNSLPNAVAVKEMLASYSALM
jgi:hypothetical protein